MTRQTKHNWHKRILYYIFLPLLAGISITIIQQNLFLKLLMVFLLLFVCSWMVWHFGLQSKLLMLLAVVLPFSWEYAITDSLVINVPSEPLLAVAIFTLLLGVLKSPGLFKQFFSGENR